MIRRFVSSAALASAALLAVAAPALAHIDPVPDRAQAGERRDVGFTVEHGCDGSPTTQLDMRLPVGVGDPAPQDIEGWEGSVETVDGDTIVTFTGGPLADDAEGTFAVTMTLPATPDTTVYFPFVQRCEVGEIRWIGIPVEPGDELDEPAPAMALTGPVAIEAPAATTSAAEPATTTAEVSATSVPVVSAQNNGDTSGSNTGSIAFIVTMATVFGLGAFVAYRARQARAANPR